MIEKKLIAIEEEINVVLEQEGAGPLPDIFKHMVLAIFKKGRNKNEEWFRQSIMIAFDSLLDNGYIEGTNIKNMRLTPDGYRRNLQHAREPKDKSQKFDAALDVITSED